MGVILFDIDGVLFDPARFGSLYREKMADALSIREDELYAAIADYYSTLEQSTDLDPKQLIKYLSSRFSVGEEILFEIFYNPAYFKESRYDDCESVLKSLSSENSLGIFSQGLREYQQYKLEHMGLLKYFDPQFILVYKRKAEGEALSAIPPEAAVIEDRHDVAVVLAKTRKTIWLNRLNPENDPEVKTIHTLKELIS